MLEIGRPSHSQSSLGLEAPCGARSRKHWAAVGGTSIEHHQIIRKVTNHWREVFTAALVQHPAHILHMRGLTGAGQFTVSHLLLSEFSGFNDRGAARSSSRQMEGAPGHVRRSFGSVMIDDEWAPVQLRSFGAWMHRSLNHGPVNLAPTQTPGNHRSAQP